MIPMGGEHALRPSALAEQAGLDPHAAWGLLESPTKLRRAIGVSIEHGVHPISAREDEQACLCLLVLAGGV